MKYQQRIAPSQIDTVKPAVLQIEQHDFGTGCALARSSLIRLVTGSVRENGIQILGRAGLKSESRSKLKN